MNWRKGRLKTIPCVFCLKGLAVNKSQAYSVFHSTPYARRRKEWKKPRMRKGPQVGRMTTVEGALMSPKFGKMIAPHGLERDDRRTKSDNRSETISAWIVILAIFALELTLIGLGHDRSLARFGTYALFILWLCLPTKWKVFRLWESRTKEGRAYHRTWRCLTCGNEWIKQ